MKIIGRIDKADFPDLKLKNIKIKVDTGSYTSSIHSHHVKEVESDGEKYIEFKLLDPLHPKYRDITYKEDSYRVKDVKSSFGNIEKRFIITTNIVIFDTEYPIELSLSERSDMKYPILLGRRFLNGRFIIDTSVRNISAKQKKASSRRTN